VHAPTEDENDDTLDIFYEEPYENIVRRVQ
jgi:hypothetical protein